MGTEAEPVRPARAGDSAVAILTCYPSRDNYRKQNARALAHVWTRARLQ